MVKLKMIQKLIDFALGQRLLTATVAAAIAAKVRAAKSGRLKIIRATGVFMLSS
jgi:hypothetical protein